MNENALFSSARPKLKRTIIVSVASTLGAASAFLAGRYLAREWETPGERGNGAIP